SALLYKLKYGNRPDLGVELGQLMGKELLPTGFFEGIDFIVPVPLARQRLRQRGYNQSEMLAQGIAQVTGLKVKRGLIRRIVNTETQTHKDRWARTDNVSQAFKLVQRMPETGCHVLFVDDVVTTGATLCACMGCLKGVANVKMSVLSVGVAHTR
ncbi:MAG: ComF family protein, partial [Prevotella sp.]